jgi:branched-chain amino acid transport system permease protein
MVNIFLNRRRVIFFFIFLGLLFFISGPKLPIQLSFIFYQMLWITMAISFNIIYGYTGYLPFGYVAFYGVGSYLTAVLWSRLGIPIILSIIMGGGGGILLSLLFAGTLRLRGIYFAIVNFSCAMALRILIANLPEEIAGGSFGIHLSAIYNPMISYYVMLGVMVLSIVTLWRVSISRLGIALRCIRDDAQAAEVMGIDIAKTRLKAWVLAAFFPSLAGGIDAWFSGIIDPASSFNLLITTKAIVYAMFWGLGTITGPIVGAIGLYTLDYIIWGRYPLLNLLILGVMISLLVLFFPRGIIGTLTRRYPSLRKVII